jgi:hypothetical protein
VTAQGGQGPAGLLAKGDKLLRRHPSRMGLVKWRLQIIGGKDVLSQPNCNGPL